METCEVVVVAGACGGVGTSSVAALLARRRAERGRAVLVDLAGSGAGLDVLLGLESSDGVRWPDLRGMRGLVDPIELSVALPRWQGVEVLAGPDGGDGLGSLWPSLVAPPLHATRGGGQTVVVDAGVGAVHPLLHRAATVLVTGQDVRGVAGALRRVGTAGAAAPPRWAGVVVRSRRRARLAPLEVAHAIGLPLLGLVPDSSAVAESTDRGLGPLPAPFSRTARAVRRLDERLAKGWHVAAAPGVGSAVGHDAAQDLPGRATAVLPDQVA